MKIGIHGKEFSEDAKHFIQEVFDCLKKREVDVFVSEPYQKIIDESKIDTQPQSYKASDDLSHLDFFMTLGGDGTLLEAVTHIGRAEVPILGVNTGRLGFLATTGENDFKKAMDALFDKKYIIEERALLRLESDQELFNGQNFALNDFTILKKDTSSMITVHAFIDGEFLNSYWADGIIVSTPTGSTGYSISCGGPLIMPQSNNFVLTPVSPHNLTVRPIVVPDDCELSFSIKGRSKNFLISLDSRYETVDDSVKLNVKKEDFTANLIKLDDSDYFKTLRQKLNWGFDVRN
ncbi:MAG: NAD kinase [Fulvivirga sp.]|nr:NAD kinase [Fulvivirga sp.]